jgi:hypothetical protein
LEVEHLAIAVAIAIKVGPRMPSDAGFPPLLGEIKDYAPDGRATSDQYFSMTAATKIG